MGRAWRSMELEDWLHRVPALGLCTVCLVVFDGCFAIFAPRMGMHIPAIFVHILAIFVHIHPDFVWAKSGWK